MEYRTTRYKYTYQRKTRDRYQIFAKPKHDPRAEWKLILDTYDAKTYDNYYTTFEHPFSQKIKSEYSPITHVFKYRKFREKIDPQPPAAPPPLCVCRRCLMGIESREGRQITREIHLDEDDPRACDWCEDDENDVLYEIL